MIREASHLRAEHRGFAAGHEQEDWYETEREVDQRLAQETGLVEKRHKVLASLNATIDQEIDDIKQVVGDWLENNPTIGKLSKVAKKARTGKKETGKTTAKTASAKTEQKAQKQTAPEKRRLRKRQPRKQQQRKRR
jgi:hypothetical protein